MSHTFDQGVELPSAEEVEVFFQSECGGDSRLQCAETVWRTGTMLDEHGRQVTVNSGRVRPIGGKLLYYLTRTLRPHCTIETGFGWGLSALLIVAAHCRNRCGDHTSIDPGFRSWTGGVGLINLQRFGAERFRIIEAPSEFVLPAMARDAAGPRPGLAFIDGSHHFDGALIDFFYLDRLLPVGGVMVFDDVDAPALESLMSFVSKNRNYVVADKLYNGTAVCRKLADDTRSWEHFEPFVIAKRRNWELPPRPRTRAPKKP